MDGLQNQINTLNQKVEQLHNIVERLTGQLTVLASPKASTSTSSFISSDTPLQPLPKLSHREEKSAYTQAHLIGSQESSELVGNSYHRDNSYSDYSRTKLVGNGYRYNNGYSDDMELVGNDDQYSKKSSDTMELVGNHHQNDNSNDYVSDSQLDPQMGYYRATMEHKDVLLEDEIPQTILPDPLHEPSVASDIQIRRLMAQLTAAYNRIAILEEQLIACRMKR